MKIFFIYLTFKERKMRWKLRRIAEEEGRSGKVVRIGQGRLRIDNV